MSLVSEEGRVFVPTLGRVPGGPYNPVDIIINEFSKPQPESREARLRSWSAFFRNAWTWSIRDDDGVYKIIGYRKHSKEYWEKDPSQEIKFPVRTRLDDVVDRMIAILQEAARQASSRYCRVAGHSSFRRALRVSPKGISRSGGGWLKL